MRKFRLFLRNIPRKAKVVLNLLLTLLLLFWVYLLLGSPTTPENLYRRAEKANLVGPGTILAEPELQGTIYEHVILAETSGGAVVFSWDRDNEQRTQLVYRKKDQGLAIVSLPKDAYAGLAARSLPVFLFDGYPNAIRAELELSLPDSQGASGILHASRESSGYFLFEMNTQKLTASQQELFSLLQLLSGNTMADTGGKSIAATVRFYDQEDTLLAEVCTSICGS